MKSCCVLQDHYDNERDKTVFHNTTSNLQDQDQDQDRFLVSDRSCPRPTVSDHITARIELTGCSERKEATCPCVSDAQVLSLKRCFEFPELSFHELNLSKLFVLSATKV